MSPCTDWNFRTREVRTMYEKRPVVSYRYNDPADTDLPQILNPTHTALLLIDMQNDFCLPEGKFAQSGRDCGATESIIPTCKRLLDAARAAGVFVVHIQQSTLPGCQSDNGGWLAFKTRDGKAPSYATIHTWGWEHVEPLKPCNDDESGRWFEPVVISPGCFFAYSFGFDSPVQRNPIRRLLWMYHGRVRPGDRNGRSVPQLLHLCCGGCGGDLCGGRSRTRALADA